MRYILGIGTIFLLTIALSCGTTTCGTTTKPADVAAPSYPGCATAPLRTSAATADHGCGTVHYFCSSGGSDSNDGLTSSTPQASWSAVISTFNSLRGGDTVALCRGGSWTAFHGGDIYNANCDVNNTCDFRDYGTGSLPVISYSGSGYLFSVRKAGHDEGYRWWNIHVENVSGKEIDWIFANDVSDVDICNTEVHGGNLAIQDAMRAAPRESLLPADKAYAAYADAERKARDGLTAKKYDDARSALSAPPAAAF